MTTFYMGYARDYPHEVIPWIHEHQVPLLTNAAHRWSKRTERLKPMWEYDTKHVVDSGGYNVQARYVDQWGNLKQDWDDVLSELDKDAPFYNWSVDHYHEWCQEHADEPEWVAAMDYACEERFDPLWPVSDRIDATIDNTVEQWHKERDYDLLPVLQGRTVDQWVDCAERMEERGVDISHIGLGTVCRMSSEERIKDVEAEIRRRLPQVETIHGFGVKINSIRIGARFDSMDSFAWIQQKVHGKTLVLRKDGEGGWYTDDEPMRDDPRTATEHTFKVYYSYVSWTLGNHDAAPHPSEIYEEQQALEYCDERPDDSHERTYSDKC